MPPTISQLIEPQMTEKKRFMIFSVVLAAAFLIVAAVVFWPLASKFLAKQAEIAAMEQQLTSLGYSTGVAPLRSREASEKQALAVVQEQWAKVSDRLKPLSNYYTENKNAKNVDYQSNVGRERLELQSLARGVRMQMPGDLGMPDEVKTNDDAATMLMHLKVISTAVRLAVDAQVNKIASFQPLPPVAHYVPNAREAYFTEFPVRIEFETELVPLLRFIHQVAKSEDDLLTVRDLRMEKKIPDGGGIVDESNPRLRAVLVLNAVVMLKDPQFIKPITTQTQKPMAPRGH